MFRLCLTWSYAAQDIMVRDSPRVAPVIRFDLERGSNQPPLPDTPAKTGPARNVNIAAPVQVAIMRGLAHPRRNCEDFNSMGTSRPNRAMAGKLNTP